MLTLFQDLFVRMLIIVTSFDVLMYFLRIKMSSGILNRRDLLIVQ
jgi:hypothetical protein